MTPDQLCRAAELAGIDPEAASAETVRADAGAFTRGDMLVCDPVRAGFSARFTLGYQASMQPH